jgi:predicted short-subunit dehydrogenase-like oxidoreductase (DUF2520 family)
MADGTIMEHKKCFSIIGAGNLGTRLMYALVEKNYDLKYIYKKSKSSTRFDLLIEQDAGKIIDESDFIIIAAQESKIRGAAETMAAYSHLEGKVFFHTSNSLTSDELISLKQKGAYTASFSPLQTFPDISPGSMTGNSADLFDGIYFLVEGDPEAVKPAETIAASLGSHVLHVDKNEKIYFHIAAVFACNFLGSILKISENQLKKVGSDLNILLPLIKQTIKNIESKGIDASRSGPSKRKETGIMEKHLALLQNDEATLYRLLSCVLNSHQETISPE